MLHSRLCVTASGVEGKATRIALLATVATGSMMRSGMNSNRS